MGNAAARASARIDLEVVIWGGEGGSVSYVVLVVEEDAELEGRVLKVRRCVLEILEGMTGHLGSGRSAQ